MNATLQTITTGNITEANKLIYSTAVVILEMTGYKMYTNYKGQYPLCIRRLEAKIKATRREVRQLSELTKGVIKKELPRKIQQSVPDLRQWRLPNNG